MDVDQLRAQHGEDRLLAERFGHRRDGRFLEVGALDGEYLSNTFYFEKALGWSGVLVEANPEQAANARAVRPGSTVAAFAAVAPGQEGEIVLNVAPGSEGYSTIAPNRTYQRILDERGIETVPVPVRAETLDAILTTHCGGALTPGTIDFATIDVEGHELEVLKGFDLRRWSPTVILLEGATSVPDLRIAWRLYRAGYARVRRVVVNDWFERRPLPARTGLLVLSYVTSIPTALRTIARETLRRLGLLDRVRRRRGVV